ncbi:MAG TPA: hypothetical protein VJ501_08240 [Burkholderiaceae bacterium]|nr:hypothetical protein [Burkholderiaceae bacterium]
MFALISRGTRTTVPSDRLSVTAVDEAAAPFVAASSGAAFRQAPASRTRSRTSGATEAHGNDCAEAAVAPSNQIALNSHEVLARILVFCRLRASNLRAFARSLLGIRVTKRSE